LWDFGAPGKVRLLRAQELFGRFEQGEEWVAFLLGDEK
jgi:hypothetical protein